MAFSELDLARAQQLFSSIPQERFYPYLGMTVQEGSKPGVVHVEEGNDAYSTTAEDLRLKVEQKILQDHLGGKMGRQVVGGLSVLEHIELQIKAEREAAEAAA